MPKIIIHEGVLTYNPAQDNDYHFYLMEGIPMTQLLEPMGGSGYPWSMCCEELPDIPYTKQTVGNVSVENGIQEDTILKLMDTALRAVTPNK
jgi:hypothetical protein